jgi:amino-acid N-acetyltransferase
MKPGYRTTTDADEPKIRALLEEAHLPTETLGTTTTEFYVAEDNGVIVGVAGFEYYSGDALLRSVAIRSDQRNKGIGSALIDWMLSRARERRVKRIVLLTDTARKFFEKKGFQAIERSLIANSEMMKSSEFTSVCPASSISMMFNLT